MGDSDEMNAKENNSVGTLELKVFVDLYLMKLMKHIQRNNTLMSLELKVYLDL